MELKDYWHALRAGWRLVVSVLVVALLAGAALTLLQSPEYTATTKLFVAARTDSQDPEELYERNQVAAGRIASYAEVLGSDAVATAVSERVGGPEVDPEEDVEVSPVPETVVLEIAVTDRSARRARDIAAAYAEVASEFVRKLEVLDESDDAAQVRLSVIDAADVPEEPASPDPVRNLVLAGLLGLGAGVGAAFARVVWRRELGEEPTGA